MDPLAGRTSPLDRAQPQSRLSQGGHRDSGACAPWVRPDRCNVMTSPIGLAAGGRVDKSQQMIKAELQLYNPPTTPGGALGSKRGVITFQFNPKEVSIQKA